MLNIIFLVLSVWLAPPGYRLLTFSALTFIALENYSCHKD